MKQQLTLYDDQEMKGQGQGPDILPSSYPKRYFFLPPGLYRLLSSLKCGKSSVMEKACVSAHSLWDTVHHGREGKAAGSCSILHGDTEQEAG